MGLLVTYEDFTGKHAAALDENTQVKIEAYITRYEKEYLTDLLGAQLYALFAAACVLSIPPAAPFTTIFNEIREDDGACIRVSKGMKDMILGFMWWEYTRDSKFRALVQGIMADKAENSREVTYDEANIYGRYNESIKSYNAIQWYITQHKTDYPTYNGQYKGIAHWAL